MRSWSPAEADTDWNLTARTDGTVLATTGARSLLHEMAEAAWQCADPGIQYDTTINAWHTCPNSGRINASNPCSEYMHLDDSACNLASLNLMKFRREDGELDVEAFCHAADTVFLAQEIIVGYSSYPTPEIERNARAYRQLGLGYANLGALLMARGLPYDSDEGRAYAAAITALMTGRGYRKSAEAASRMGPFAGYRPNAAAMLGVIAKHRAAVGNIEHAHSVPADLLSAARQAWDDALDLGEVHGFRNAQATVLAPTGTISFMMDCDTTGVEPDFSLVKSKKLVGGGEITIVNKTVPMALEKLGYAPAETDQIVAYIDERNTIVGAPSVKTEHYPVFDCAIGERAIHYMGHVKMMGAVAALHLRCDLEDGQPAGADDRRRGRRSSSSTRGSSASRRSPSTATTARSRSRSRARATGRDSACWRSRSGGACRTTAPRSGASSASATTRATSTSVCSRTGRRGDVFVDIAKEGTTLAGLMNSFMISVSLGLQYGVPLEVYVSKFSHMRFEPSGPTNDADIRIAKVARRLHLPLARQEVPRHRDAAGARHHEPRGEGAHRTRQTTSSTETAARSRPRPAVSPGQTALFNAWEDAVECAKCGGRMVRTGSCYTCRDCGQNTGCS